jgi:hypothetical protein
MISDQMLGPLAISFSFFSLISSFSRGKEGKKEGKENHLRPNLSGCLSDREGGRASVIANRLSMMTRS